MRRFARISQLACALAVCWALVAPPAQADEYDRSRSGHPLRIVAYVLHPIGWMLDFLIFQPAHKIGNSAPLKEFFGHRDQYRENPPERFVPDPSNDPDV